MKKMLLAVCLVWMCFSLSARKIIDSSESINLQMNNRIKAINIRPGSHSITDQTQRNWNGIVRRMSLQTTPKTDFDDIQIYLEPEQKPARVKGVIIENCDFPLNGYAPMNVESRERVFRSPKLGLGQPIDKYLMNNSSRRRECTHHSCRQNKLRKRSSPAICNSPDELKPKIN